MALFKFLVLILFTMIFATNRVIIISIDGMRHDYLEKFGSRFKFPNFKKLVTTGGRALRLVPQFPPDTFPQHTSIITGLYAESHGIVGNQFLDPKFQTYFTVSNPESKLSRWWGGEPIWVTNVKQGKISGCVFWPGSEVDWNGVRPNYWHKFNDSIPSVNRVDMLLEYLDKPKPQRPSFMTLYFSVVDHAGHSYGPDHDHIGESIEVVDQALGHLVDGLAKRGENNVDLIIVSDHGMTAMSPDRRVFLDDYIKDELQHLTFHNFATLFPNGGPNNQRHVTLQPKSKEWEEVILKKLKNAHPQLKVFLKSDPEFQRYRLRASRRVGDIVLMANLGWNIALRSLGGNGTVGSHGFDTIHHEMSGILIVNGPSFKHGASIPPVENIHIYSLMAKLLHLREAPNNGTYTHFQKLLK